MRPGTRDTQGAWQVHDGPSPGAVLGVIWARLPGPRARPNPDPRGESITTCCRRWARFHGDQRQEKSSTGPLRWSLPPNCNDSFQGRTTESVNASFRVGNMCYYTQNTLFGPFRITVPFKNLCTLEFLGSLKGKTMECHDDFTSSSNEYQCYILNIRCASRKSV